MERCARCEAVPELATSGTWRGNACRLLRRPRFRDRFHVVPPEFPSQGSIKLRFAITKRPAFVAARGLGCRGFDLVSTAGKSVHCMKGNQPNTVSGAGQLEGFEGGEAISPPNHSMGSDESQCIREELLKRPGSDPRSKDYRRELLILAAPAILGQAIDPLAQLMETAYIGRLGSVELASAGVSVSIFNIISKLFNVPLLSITTSFVAEDISKKANRNTVPDGMYLPVNGADKELFYVMDEKRERLPSVSSALVLAVVIGVGEALALFWASGPLLSIMGISPSSSMRIPAHHFLRLRALGAPANVVSLAIQGVFRGFKDTQTPLFCVGLGNISAAILFPLLMYNLRLGISGAALATVASQYIATFLLLWRLSRRAILLPPKILELDFSGYLKSGGLLLGRTLSVLMTMTLATSMAARQGSLAMAAHQICLQVWLAVSLLSDALALSAQAMIASSFAQFDYERVKGIASYVLKTGVLSGLALAVILGASFGSISRLFTSDIEVQKIVYTGLLFVSTTQPINALAFIFDGLHFGVSDFSYSALSMMVIGAISSLVLLYAPSVFGLQGVWFGLTLFMGLRMAAGFIRLQWRTGPWWRILHPDVPVPKVAG